MKTGDVFKTNQDEIVNDVNSAQQKVKARVPKNPYHPTVYGVGFIGVGDFRSRKNGKKTNEYSVWHGMLQRCYDENSRKKYNAYIGCSVHKDWHNFQNFAKWLASHNYHNLGYELDKDLLISGNKIYSDITCCLIPTNLNKLIAISGNNSSGLPVGVTFLKKANRYRARLRVDGKHVELGWFKGISEASDAYKKAKETRVKSEALRYKNIIDASVFNALMLWRVD